MSGDNAKKITLHVVDASDPLGGVWTGGLEGEGEIGVDIFFDNGKIEIGVHDGVKGAVLRISAYQALCLAGLLTDAANDPSRSPAASDDAKEG